MPDIPKIISAAEVARYFGKTESWVYDHVHDLGGAKIGGSVFFTEEGLIDALQCFINKD